MRHKEWKMGTMVERIQPVGPSNLLNNMVKVFLIASSSSRGMKARGRDLQVPVSANWTQTTGTTQQNTTQHNAKKKERKPLFASFSSELDTNNNTSNKAWIQRLFRFPQ